MKMHSNAYMILMVVILLIQQIISGCTATVTKDLHKEDVYRDDAQKENLIKEDLHKADLLKDELRKKKAGMVSQNLFRDKCSLCHELPDIDAYPYTPEQWASIIDIMHDTKAARKFITIEETEKIKSYLGRISQTN